MNLASLGGRLATVTWISLLAFLASQCGASGTACPEPGQCETGGAGAVGGSGGVGGDATGGTGGEASTGGSGGATGGDGGTGGEPTGGMGGSGGGVMGCPSGCADGNPCTADYCVGPATCDHVPVADGAACNDGQCVGGLCTPTCTDNIQNQTETDVDCGGPCPGCPLGTPCNVDSDCAIGACSAGKCGCPALDHIVIAELRPATGNAATFVEIYNPTSVLFNKAVVLWINGVNKWQGNVYLNPGTRMLLELQLPKSGRVAMAEVAGPYIDVVCFCDGFGCDETPWIHCNGAQIQNPNDADGSLERRPIGLNCIDTDDSVADFVHNDAATPGM